MSRTFRHLRKCFGCGEENPVSLGVVNSATAEGAEARVRFGRNHQGAPGLVHGGLLATLLDEAMGSVPYDASGIRLTSEMTVRYRRPTPIETELVCRARLGRTSPARFSVDATIVASGSEDVVLVEASATYVLSSASAPER